MGAKRLGYGGEMTRVENRGKTTRGETSCYQMVYAVTQPFYLSVFLEIGRLLYPRYTKYIGGI